MATGRVEERRQPKSGNVASAVTLQPELYRIQEAALVLAVSPRMIHTLIERGELTPVRLPGLGTKRKAVRISRLDLMAFVTRLRGAAA